MATNHKSVRKFSTIVKFVIQPLSPRLRPARRLARKQPGCQPRLERGREVRFVNGILEVF
ncbi:MAG: hypothetical protein KJ077_11825 [Anaerolineae bacterium]|nr:hypothetical protein [Anaerolineae bacterium]